MAQTTQHESTSALHESNSHSVFVAQRFTSDILGLFEACHQIDDIWIQLDRLALQHKVGLMSAKIWQNLQIAWMLPGCK